MKRFIPLLIILAALVPPAANAVDLPAAPDAGTMSNSNLLAELPAATNTDSPAKFCQMQLDMAVEQRHEKNPSLAMRTLIHLLETNIAVEFQRKALFELALATQDNGEYVKAQQVFSQYIHRFPDDASVPEVLLRQGLLYREMGVNTLAISKFYSVMSTALKLRLDNIDYYKKLVLQAQTEIADTYYTDGEFQEASEFYTRILKVGSPSLNKAQLTYKLIRSLNYLSNNTEIVAKAQSYLRDFPNSGDLPEIRFILASAYKSVERNDDAMQQVLLLLQAEQTNINKNPETWAYWQRRAGNEIANQLYKEADYIDALQIYQNLAGLDSSAAWQAPVLYQVGLVYEQLQQWDKATNTYAQILARKDEMTQTNSPPSLAPICEMAKWRTDYIQWSQKAHAANDDFHHSPLLKPAAPAAAELSPTNPPTASR